jgi:hypothetical protein
MDPQQPNLSLNEYLTFFRTLFQNRSLCYAISISLFFFVPQLHFAASLV